MLRRILREIAREFGIALLSGSALCDGHFIYETCRISTRPKSTEFRAKTISTAYADQGEDAENAR